MPPKGIDIYIQEIYVGFSYISFNIGIAAPLVRAGITIAISRPKKPSAANPIFNIPKIVTDIGRCRIFFL